MGTAQSIFVQEVLPFFEAGAVRKAYLAKARAVAWRLGAKGAFVCVDDVRCVCPPPEDLDPRLMGAIFMGRDWVVVDRLNSHRRMSHNRPVAIFQRTEFAGE